MAPRITVLHVITRLVRGGAQRVVLDLVAYLPRDEFHQVLVSGEQVGAEGSLWPDAEALGVRLIRLPELVREISPLRDLRALRALRRIIRECRPDIVHAHTSKAGLLGCAAAHKERVRGIILAPHGHIFAQGAEIPGVPRRGWKRRLLAWAARRNAQYAHVVVAPNESEREDGMRHNLWAREQSLVIPNGIDVARFCPGDKAAARDMLGFSRTVKAIGVVARLTREKGVDIAIQAVAKLNDVEMFVVGDGPERSALEQLAKQLGVAGRVRFLGERNDVHMLLPAFDAVLVPSRTEAHGLAAAEAMACAIPIVASDVGGLRSLVLPEQTGLAVPLGDATTMAAALRRVLDDSSLATRLAKAGRHHIEDHFSRDAMLLTAAALYRRLANGTLPAAPDAENRKGQGTA